MISSSDAVGSASTSTFCEATGSLLGGGGGGSASSRGGGGGGVGSSGSSTLSSTFSSTFSSSIFSSRGGGGGSSDGGGGGATATAPPSPTICESFSIVRRPIRLPRSGASSGGLKYWERKSISTWPSSAVTSIARAV